MASDGVKPTMLFTWTRRAIVGALLAGCTRAPAAPDIVAPPDPALPMPVKTDASVDRGRTPPPPVETGAVDSSPDVPRDLGRDLAPETSAVDSMNVDLRPDLEPITPGAGPAPPATWKEHWFEHTQDLALFAYDEHAAIYFDADVDRGKAAWILPFMSRLWQYTKKTYGDGFGPDPRLYSIHHQGRYGGGHPAYYFDAGHDNRNVSDAGPGPWTDKAIDIPSHEVAHVVESANNGAYGSPAFSLWRDSKWAEIYQYDAYVALGMPVDAQRLLTRFSATADSFPRAGTHWFRDWFFPLWKDHGGAQVMARFFQLLAKHYPKRADGKRYARDLNWGEYIHFTSGAAGTDLKQLATAAFGWPAAWDAQWAKARADFPMITY
jgi:hypothetical protein